MQPLIRKYLLALKEVNAKETPELTQEEAIDLQHLDDAFVLAQAEKNAQDDLLETLDTSLFILDWLTF